MKVTAPAVLLGCTVLLISVAHSSPTNSIAGSMSTLVKPDIIFKPNDKKTKKYCEIARKALAGMDETGPPKSNRAGRFTRLFSFTGLHSKSSSVKPGSVEEQLTNYFGKMNHGTCDGNLLTSTPTFQSGRDTYRVTKVDGILTLRPINMDEAYHFHYALFDAMSSMAMSERDYQKALTSNNTLVLAKIRSLMEKSLAPAWKPSVKASSHVNSILDGWGNDKHGAVDNLPGLDICQFVNLPYAVGSNSEPSSGATESSDMDIVGQNLATVAKACF